MLKSVHIRRAILADIPIVAELQMKLWPGHIVEELNSEIERVVSSVDGVVFIAFINDNPVGFAESRLRVDYVEGTHTCPVGYLEGIYVRPEHRRLGVAMELIRYSEDWAKNKGCSEFASDCEWNNQASQDFHLKAGFKEINRVVCFAKTIKRP